MVQPLTRALDVDLKAWINEIADDRDIGLRSALALGQPTTLVESHFLSIVLEYDERPMPLRERFRPLAAEVMPIDRARAMWNRSGGTHGPVPPPLRSPTSTEIAFNTTVIYMAMRKGDTTGVGLDARFVKMSALPAVFSAPLTIPYLAYSQMIPYEKRAVNPEWAALLMMSVQRPRMDLAELMVEELLACETSETLEFWRRKFHKDNGLG